MVQVTDKSMGQKRKNLNTIWQDRLVFFENKELADALQASPKSLENNGVRKMGEKAVNSFYLRMEQAMKVLGYSYDSLDDYVGNYNNTKEFYNGRVSGLKTLFQKDNLTDFFNYAFTLYHDKGAANDMVSKWSGILGKNRLSKLCTQYYDSFKKGKALDASMLFLMIHDLMPFQDKSNMMSPERHFMELEKCLYDFMQGNVENFYKDNVPNVFSEIFDEVKRHSPDGSNDEKRSSDSSIYRDKDGETPFFNVLKMVTITDRVLFDYYGSRYRSELYNNVQSFKNEVMRVFNMDGYWQEKEAKGRITNKFWYIEYMPYAGCYLFRRYEKDDKEHIYYFTDYHLQSFVEGEDVKFIVMWYDHSYYTITRQEIPNDTAQVFSSPGIKLDADMVTCTEFNLVPDSLSKIDRKWELFKGKTFVKLGDEEKTFRLSVENCRLENRHPEVAMDCINPDVAITRNAIFVHYVCGNKDRILKVWKFNDDFDETIDGIDSYTVNDNIIICIAPDGKQYLGFDEMNTYLDIEKELQQDSSFMTEVNDGAIVDIFK